MTKPTVSKDFNLEDIRKIREYNLLRHIQVTPDEIIADTKRVLKELKSCFRNVNVHTLLFLRLQIMTATLTIHF